MGASGLALTKGNSLIFGYPEWYSRRAGRFEGLFNLLGRIHLKLPEILIFLGVMP